MKRLPQIIFMLLCVFLMDLESANAHIKSLFIFGDSIFDPGNNHFVKNCTIQANFTPYGSSYFLHPTGRFTNGRTIADFIAQFLKIKFQRPYQELYHQLANGRQNGFPANGVNFASGGSGLLNDTNKDAGVTSIHVQLEQFQALVDQEHIHKNQTTNSIFFLASGSNDVFTYFLEPGSPNLTPRVYAIILLQQVTRFLDKIYKLGARRIVIFPMGPLGCIPGRVLLPGATTTECFGKINAMAKIFNAGLERLVQNIPTKYPNAIGYSDVSEACCGGGPLNVMLQCGYP
ncbi:GDSL esterase/lipase 6, partial [Tanacetum coccineum]